jgi:hypothetical protein
VRHVNEGEPFPSDLFTALTSLGALVDVSMPDGSSLQLPLLDFAHQYQDSKPLYCCCCSGGLRSRRIFDSTSLIV